MTVFLPQHRQAGRRARAHQGVRPTNYTAPEALLSFQKAIRRGVIIRAVTVMAQTAPSSGIYGSVLPNERLS